MKKPPAREPRKGPAAHSAAPVTLAMVAQAADVSPSTVSRILNGTAVVSAAKEAAVREAIRKLGFSPNPVARGLAGGRTMSIGVLTQTISSPFYGESLHGIEDVLERAGYIPLFVSGHWSEAEERAGLEALLARRVDGLIVLAGRMSNASLQRYAKALPLVLVGRSMDGPRIHSLKFDNQTGGYLATRHLLELRHTRIAFIAGDRAHEDACEREAGFRMAMAEAGLEVPTALVVPGDYTEASGMLAVDRLIEGGAPFSAVFASNDQMAIGAALALHRHNLRVPDDVSLIGFDDLAMAKYAIPPLTTVRQSVYEVGAEAATAMLALLAGQSPSTNLPAPVLVPRETTRRLLR